MSLIYCSMHSSILAIPYAHAVLNMILLTMFYSFVRSGGIYHRIYIVYGDKSEQSLNTFWSCSCNIF